MQKLVYAKNGVEIFVKSKDKAKINTYQSIIQNLFNRSDEMRKEKDWKTEDYQRLMMSSSVATGKSCQKPLIDTNQEKWNEKFDANYKIQKELNWVVINTIAIIAGIAMIILFNMY